MQTQDIEAGLTETVSLLDKLRMAIYRMEFAPGQRLVESELARKYDTSRGAVREAIALLQNEGLVSRERNRSADVEAMQVHDGSRSSRSGSSLAGEPHQRGRAIFMRKGKQLPDDDGRPGSRGERSGFAGWMVAGLQQAQKRRFLRLESLRVS